MPETKGPLGWLKGTKAERAKFDRYKAQGGGLGYAAWMRQGKPSPPPQISSYAANILEKVKRPLPPEARVAPPTPSELVGRAREAGAVAGAGGGAGGGVGIQTPATSRITQDPSGLWVRHFYDDKGKEIVSMQEVLPANFFSKQGQEEAELGEQRRQAEATEALRQSQLELERQRFTREGEISPFEESSLALQRQRIEAEQASQMEQLGWQREQARMQQVEQERQYRSQLAAKPISWLQYAAYTGEKPVIQPWMMPLSQGQYGWQAGEQIPGFSATTGRGMPGLLRPSGQLWSRMGPTAREQYKGYQQFTTGARPEETEFRLRSTSPPGGRSIPLRWMR